MPGSIKIDDGSGNYTILTNAGSLGSDKTITIPNETATLATTNGITEVDQWQLTANITTTGTNDITANLARPSGTLQGTYIGTGMTESSGIFTFPSTGKWIIQVHNYVNGASGDGAGISIIGTNDNFSSEDIIAQAINGKYGSGTKDASTSFCQVLIDVQNTSNDKIKFESASVDSGTVINGSSATTLTSFMFMKLGET